MQVCIFAVLLVAGLCRISKMLLKDILRCYSDITSEDPVGSVFSSRCDLSPILVQTEEDQHRHTPGCEMRHNPVLQITKI